MTTIAYDGRYVASDSLVVCSDHKLIEPAKKLIEGANDKLYAICGTAASFQAWIDWYEQTGPDQKNGPQIPKLSGECQDVNFMVFDYEKGCLMFSYGCPYAIWRKEPRAWGSGEQHALTALDCGMKAHNAVLMASKRDPFTDDRIVEYDLKEQRFVD